MKEDRYGRLVIDQREIIDGLIDAAKDSEAPKEHVHIPYTDGCEWYCTARDCPDRWMDDEVRLDRTEESTNEGGRTMTREERHELATKIRAEIKAEREDAEYLGQELVKTFAQQDREMNKHLRKEIFRAALHSGQFDPRRVTIVVNFQNDQWVVTDFETGKEWAVIEVNSKYSFTRRDGR